jgi:hypothetical protein
VDARSEEHRPRSRGIGWPSDEDEARERLLAGADAYYAEGFDANKPSVRTSKTFAIEISC